MGALTGSDILFYVFALVAAVSAIVVVFVRNPIYSALFLALSMSALGVLFFVLQAYFIAVAQITVYAGAVMVLFVMVIMLFDLRHEVDEILKLSPVNMAKFVAAAVLCGFLVGTGWLAVSAVSGNPGTSVAPSTTATDLAKPQNAVLPPKTTDQANTADQNPAQTQTNPDEDLTSAEAAQLVQPPTAAAGAQPTEQTAQLENNEKLGSTTELSKILFSKYVFAFEAVSLLLLVAIVGSVALAKSKGGTHHVAS